MKEKLDGILEEKSARFAGTIFIKRFAHSSQISARLRRAIRSSRTVLCSSQTFKFISCNLILKLKSILNYCKCK